MALSVFKIKKVSATTWYTLPTPITLKPSINALDSQKTGRDNNTGKMFRDKIAEKLKYTVEVPEGLTNTQVRDILAILLEQQFSAYIPNPKTGTVTDDPATAVKESKAGKVDFRMDKTGNVAIIAGKLSFDAEKLVANVKAVVSAIQAAKPNSVRGVFIKSLTLASTMGVGVPCVLSTDAE